jgi:hypothetical protein
MNSHKTRCRWCNKIYSTAGAYSNHILSKHPEHLPSSKPLLLRRKPDLTQNAPHIEQPILHGHTEFESSETHLDVTGLFQTYPDNEITDETEEEDPDAEESFPTPKSDDVHDKIRRFPAEFKAGEPVREFPFSAQRSEQYNHLYPFLNARDYKLARFFTMSKVPKSRINIFFQDNIISSRDVENPTSKISFRSGYTFYKQTAKMVEEQPPWQSGYVEFPLRPKSEFRFRSILHCIQYLLRQRAYVDHMLWEPVQVINTDGDRIYSEINTADWWWQQQVSET